MSQPFEVSPSHEREMAFGRILDCTPRAAFRCWSEPTLITRWFTPPPWKTVAATIDLRPGGANEITMEGPNGERVPNRGVYLEVVPDRKIVFTSAFADAWTPADTGPHDLMFVGALTFEPEGERRCRYTARVAHWSKEARRRHEEMGFYTGWGIATDQLEAVAGTLA